MMLEYCQKLWMSQHARHHSGSDWDVGSYKQQTHYVLNVCR